MIEELRPAASKDCSLWNNSLIFSTKDSTQKKPLPELITEFSKVAVYKINIQIAIAFIYTNDQPLERETNKTIPFTTAF